MVDVRLSVIVPTYNRASYLQQCLRSVVDVDIPGLEVIVVDDGSTDSTAQVVGGFGARVRYLRQSNTGPSGARNAGFAASRGRYVAFLDSDDQWLPGVPEVLAGVLDSRPDLPLVFADARIGNPQTGFRSFVETFGGVSFRALFQGSVSPGVHLLDKGGFFRQVLRRNVVPPGCLFLRRETFERTGGFDPRLYVAEDWELVLRLASEHQFAFCEGLEVTIYLKHAGSLTGDLERMELGYLEALERLLVNARLAATYRRLVETDLRRRRFDWGYGAYDRGELDLAQERLAACIRQSPLHTRIKPLAFWLVSHLRPETVRRARAYKHALFG